MSTVNGMTHNKMIFSFSPGIVKHFIGNALYSSDHSVTQPIHVPPFFTINKTFYKPQKKDPEEPDVEDEGVRKCISLFMSRKERTRR
jgi:hypothetical protein